MDSKAVNFCDRVDIHALDVVSKPKDVVAVAGEHGFRGVVVTLARLDETVSVIRSCEANSGILPIAAIDFPFGNSNVDVRVYSMISAKEKGASEIEIVAPYHAILDKNWRKIDEDLSLIMTNATKININVKYVLDINSLALDDAVKTKLCRIISSNKVGIISTSLGFIEESNDHGNNIISMRSLKTKTGCNIKTYISTNNVKEFAIYPKAGADLVGVEWQKAPYMIHAYEDMLENR